MADYELFYFPLSGRAGVARLLFNLAEVKFTDTTYKFEEWPVQKKDRKRFPLGQMPVLRVNDTFVAESKAINAYLAAEFGFFGSNRLEQAHATMIEHHSTALLALWATPLFQKDVEGAKQLHDKFFTEQLGEGLSYLEDILKANKGGDGYFIGDKISLADVAFLDVIAVLYTTPRGPAVIDQYPKLNALRERLSALPAFAKHLPTRRYPSPSWA